MSDCVFVEWISADVQRLSAFYEYVCGWHISAAHDVTIAQLGSGTYARIAMPAPRQWGGAVVEAALVQRPHGATIVTIATDDFDAMCTRIVEAGGHIVSAIILLAHSARFVYAEDTDGRVFGCIERAQNA